MRRIRHLRGLTAALAVALAGCAASGDDATRYLDDARFRRDTLVASLVNPANGYSRLRLEHYATGSAGDWDARPAWDPVGFDLGAARDPERRVALGADAFHRYPVQLLAQANDTAPTVTVRLADGSDGVALTCASCHARLVDGALVDGLANERVELGFGPGRVDVAPPPGEEPIAIPDLRVAALETNLQRDGAVRNGGLATLAVRIETLIITSHGAAVRPPREIALALAAYVQSLAPAPAAPPMTTATMRGARVFAARCAPCHAPPAFAGPPVALDVVGTDPRVGESADRGTGGYRVPSLRGVSTRGRLLHDASVPNLAAMLDPKWAHAGHPFSRDLPDADRAALLVYLQTL
jgi:mono/diheme cytochrome c family protein